MERSFLGSREQRRLADPRLAANDDRAASLVDPVDERVQLCQLTVAPEERL
jgi:hypothetical protein